MKPRIGLVVNWIVPCGKQKGEILPAMIVKLYTEDRCDLCVFNVRPTNTHFYMPAIHDEAKGQLGSWHYA